MKGDVSLEKIREFDFKFDLDFHQEFSEARGLLLILCHERVNNLGQNRNALVLGWRQIWTFMIKISSLDAQTSANKVSMFKLTIDE